MEPTLVTEFERQTDPYRRELLAHCYQMLGSVHDAEDIVQETLLRAWRAFDRYDAGRSSVRTWLHRIATNACLTALKSRSRRPLPSGLGAPSDSPEQPLVPAMDVPWLEPLPDALWAARPSDPVSTVLHRSSMRLALVAAMQHLPTRQRAVLILREVLEFSAADVADALDTSVPAVNSALQRARARLEELGVREETVVETSDQETRAVVDSYLRAFERADVDELTRLLTDDAILEMPPVPLWFSGREDYGRFMAHLYDVRGPDWRMLLTAANGQHALAAYVRVDGGYRSHTIQVLALSGERICANIVFADPRVFALFNLPASLDVDGEPQDVAIQ